MQKPIEGFWFANQGPCSEIHYYGDLGKGAYGIYTGIHGVGTKMNSLQAWAIMYWEQEVSLVGSLGFFFFSSE